MSQFSDVDRSPTPGRLIDFLDDAAVAESGIKHYAAAAHSTRHPARPILDVGCGAGHDLKLLASLGLRAVGVDPSGVMLGEARTRGVGSALVRAVGEVLPFGNEVFGGGRIERVLMHVVDPSVVLGEILRCIERGGLLTVFEPDWSRFEVTSDLLPPKASWISSATNPEVGGQLWTLLDAAGCQVLDRVEELSIWRSLDTLEKVTRFPWSVRGAVIAGRLDSEAATDWIEEQRTRDADGRFEAMLPKVLIVARKR